MWRRGNNPLGVKWKTVEILLKYYTLFANDFLR